MNTEIAAPSMQEWFASNNITEVECLVPDISGILRGKILPTHKFLAGHLASGIRIPEAIFTLTIDGQYVDKPTAVSDSSIDIYMQPDPASLRLVPWYSEPTAQIICDCQYADGSPLEISPRQVLKRVLDLYKEEGLKPVVAPELEFYLVQRNLDPDYPLQSPPGYSGRMETHGQAYGIDATNEFDFVVEDIYEYCEIQKLDVDTLSHESGPAQLEINFNHGDPLELADQIMLFKRTVRQAAFKHNLYATFMAKPHAGAPGSAMHIHQSLVREKDGQNIFSGKEGKPSRKFLHYIGGLQRYMSAALPFFAPNVNSYRRLVPDNDAPTNTHWAMDNRTVPLRVPNSTPAAMRVEHRVPGADSNPYLAIAAMLACGYLGMKESIKPSDPVEGSAYRYVHALPLSLEESLNKLNYTKPLKQVLGEQFVDAYQEVKAEEMKHFNTVISSWEREHLLLNV